jgi:hypothetical protein
MDQVVEYLPTKYEVLSVPPKTERERERERTCTVEESDIT